MRKRLSKITVCFACLGFVLPATAEPAGKNKVSESNAKIAARGGPEKLWVDPVDIQSRNLFYGPGGKSHQPTGTKFTFVDEDMDGTNPKYNVKAEDGVKWKIKLGAEAKPETVASRLVWAVGYYAQEDYFLPDVHVSDLPAHLHRGQKLVGEDGEMRNVRLKRHQKSEEKLGDWRWREDPFARSREWNGLRVLMAVINNWDLKDENNAVYEKGEERIYMVSDLGASFGTTGYNPNHEVSKGNLRNYERSHFITKTTGDYVDFGVPSRPALIVFFNPREFFSRMNMRWIGKRVPRSDARWMGQLLARLSHEQIRDAFRAAGYTPEETDGFAKVVEHRIGELAAL
jgi:hypothetical protein